MQPSESLRSSRPSRAKGKGKSALDTPQLTPDNTDEIIVVKEEVEEDTWRGRSRSRSSRLDADSSSSPPPKTPPQMRRKLDSPEDVMFEEYLHRSQRRLTREFSPQPADSWKNWKWSQLKEPVWVADSHVGYQSDDRRTTRPDLPESFERGVRPGGRAGWRVVVVDLLVLPKHPSTFIALIDERPTKPTVLETTLLTSRPYSSVRGTPFLFLVFLGLLSTAFDSRQPKLPSAIPFQQQTHQVIDICINDLHDSPSSSSSKSIFK